MSSYLIPNKTVRNETLAKNSRFIATAGYVSTTEDARDFIANVRSEMPDASHHVYAFRIGYGNSVTEGLSDDGEPSGTSGPPIMAILRGTEIGDVVVVVTRYFGGTKLGTGGLVRAYGDAARQILAIIPVELKIPRSHLILRIPYTFYETIKKMITEYDGLIKSEDFSDVILIELSMPTINIAEFSIAVRDATAGQCEPIEV